MAAYKLELTIVEAITAYEALNRMLNLFVPLHDSETSQTYQYAMVKLRLYIESLGGSV